MSDLNQTYALLDYHRLQRQAYHSVIHHSYQQAVHKHKFSIQCLHSIINNNKLNISTLNTINCMIEVTENEVIRCVLSSNTPKHE